MPASTPHTFTSFNEEQPEAWGIANKNTGYVKGIGYIIISHALHHKNVIQETIPHKEPGLKAGFL